MSLEYTEHMGWMRSWDQGSFRLGYLHLPVCPEGNEPLYFSPEKKLLLGAVSLELPFFLSYVTPRPILETRCFVLGLHLQHFCPQQTAISLLFYCEEWESPWGAHSDPYKPRALRFNFSFWCAQYVVSVVTIWTNKRSFFTWEAVGWRFQKLFHQVLQVLTNPGPCDSGRGRK